MLQAVLLNASRKKSAGSRRSFLALRVKREACCSVWLATAPSAAARIGTMFEGFGASLTEMALTAGFVGAATVKFLFCSRDEK